MHPFWKAWLKPQLWTFVVLWNIMELYTNNRQDGRLVQISHRSTKEEIFSLTLTLRSVFLSPIFSCGSSWFTMVQSLDRFGRISSAFFLQKLSPQLSWALSPLSPTPYASIHHMHAPGQSWTLRRHMVHSCLHKPRASASQSVDARLQVGSVLLIFGDGWSKRPGNSRKPPQSPHLCKPVTSWTFAITPLVSQQVEQDLQRFSICCQDHQFSSTSIQCFRRLVRTFLQLLIVRCLLPWKSQPLERIGGGY